jgi:hypothetical protein
MPIGSGCRRRVGDRTSPVGVRSAVNRAVPDAGCRDDGGFGRTIGCRGRSAPAAARRRLRSTMAWDGNTPLDTSHTVGRAASSCVTGRATPPTDSLRAELRNRALTVSGARSRVRLSDLSLGARRPVAPGAARGTRIGDAGGHDRPVGQVVPKAPRPGLRGPDCRSCAAASTAQTTTSAWGAPCFMRVRSQASWVAVSPSQRSTTWVRSSSRAPLAA